MAEGLRVIDGVSRRIVSRGEWEAARAGMTEKEKEHMRAGDALAAERRRMPWMKMEGAYRFEGERGWMDLPGLFGGRRQLMVYHFMFGPEVPGWPEKGCVGCSMLADQLGHLDHLKARGIELVFVSAAPLANLLRYRERMGWRVPWYSTGEEFNRDCGVSKQTGHSFGLSVFYSGGGEVFRTHFVGQRGGEALGTVWSYVDLSPLGRQEKWEDSPEGTPRGEPYQWWRRHGEYEGLERNGGCGGGCGCGGGGGGSCGTS